MKERIINIIVILIIIPSIVITIIWAILDTSIEKLIKLPSLMKSLKEGKK